MQTTKLTAAGWTAAAHGFREMLRHQLPMIEGSGGRDGPGDRIVYRFGGTVDPAPCDPGARRVAFWPSGRELPGQGGWEGWDRIVVPSHWSRARVIAAGGRPDRVAVVAPGIDGEAFSPLSRGDRAAVRASLGAAEGETVLLHLGDPGDDAGTDLVLRAFARLRAAGVRGRLVLAKEDPDLDPDYDRILRAAGADEPGLFEAGCLAAVVTVPGRLAPEHRRLLYAAADVLVSPHRACAFAFPVVEAIACGCPVVVTRGGAADDICDDDLAWRIPGTACRDGAGGCWIEPDLDALTDALAELTQGRGFDRVRFAAARLRLLRDATWETSARRLADVLAGSSADEDCPAPGPSLLRGIPQPTDARFPARPVQDLAAERRRAVRRATCPEPRDLSVVVQGPCSRAAAEPGAPSIDAAIASIRRSFPGAQIVVSTWAGSDIDGLDADDIVLSPDPGPIRHPRQAPNNVNRMVTSTANGLAAATRPFCIKTRNDLRFASDRAIRRPLQSASPATGFERRIWVMASRIETSLRPYHPSDMMMFGRTADLRCLWDVPERTAADLFLPDPDSLVARMSPEQALFIGYLNGIGVDVALESSFDGRWDTISGSIRHMLASFDVFDESDTDLVMPRRFVDGKKQSLCYTRAGFDELRAAFDDDPDATSDRIHRAFHDTLSDLLGPTEAVA